MTVARHAPETPVGVREWTRSATTEPEALATPPAPEGATPSGMSGRNSTPMPDTMPEPTGGNNAPRRAVSRRLRFEILRRDNYACRYCGGSAHREYVTDVWLSRYGDTDNLPRSFGVTVDAWIASGLSYLDFDDAADITVTNNPRDPWRYFCGVCWKRVAFLQDRAQQLIQSGEC